MQPAQSTYLKVNSQEYNQLQFSQKFLISTQYDLPTNRQFSLRIA